MKVTCPMCNTRYDMKSKIPKNSQASMVCSVCNVTLNIKPRGIWYLYRPNVVVRQG